MSFSEKELLVCAPDHFDVIYEINAWMSVKNRPVQSEAKIQWKNYEAALKTLNFKLHYLEPKKDVPDLVFTANHGLVLKDKAVIARMKYKERQLEQQYYTQWFTQHGLSTYEPQNGFYEGEGDSFIVGDTLYYGYGFRSDKEVAEEIKDFLGLNRIIYIRLTDPYYYHLDTCFAPLGDGMAMINEQAIEAESVKEISKNLQLIKAAPEEAKKFCCNAVVAGKDMVIPEGCPKISSELEKLGFNLQQVKLDQYLKAGGAAKCLCLKLWN